MDPQLSQHLKLPKKQSKVKINLWHKTMIIMIIEQAMSHIFSDNAAFLYVKQHGDSMHEKAQMTQVHI